MGDGGGGGIISSYLLTVENLRFTSRTAGLNLSSLSVRRKSVFSLRVFSSRTAAAAAAGLVLFRSNKHKWR